MQGCPAKPRFGLIGKNVTKLFLLLHLLLRVLLRALLPGDKATHAEDKATHAVCAQVVPTGAEAHSARAPT